MHTHSTLVGKALLSLFCLSLIISVSLFIDMVQLFHHNLNSVSGVCERGRGRGGW